MSRLLQPQFHYYKFKLVLFASYKLQINLLDFVNIEFYEFLWKLYVRSENQIIICQQPI